ncbi:TPA: hypothetical protein J5G32_004230 [Escherichia coli]|nr:hypothetical protein [Escherichia coli]HBA4082882.1 hypothetical protein [Escherichia coli]
MAIVIREDRIHRVIAQDCSGRHSDSFVLNSIQISNDPFFRKETYFRETETKEVKSNLEAPAFGLCAAGNVSKGQNIRVKEAEKETAGRM